MSRENQPLVIDEPVLFKKRTVEVQDLMKTIDCLERIYRLYLILTKKN